MQFTTVLLSIASLAASASALAVRSDNHPFLLKKEDKMPTNNAAWAQYQPASLPSAIIFYEGASYDPSIAGFAGYIVKGGRAGQIFNNATAGTSELFIDPADNQLKVGEYSSIVGIEGVRLDGFTVQEWQQGKFRLGYDGAADAQWFWCNDGTTYDTVYFGAAPVKDGLYCGTGANLAVEYQ